MAHDHYELLQVHPRASADAIAAAYERLRGMYDPARLEGAADELVALARKKRDELDRAFAVLSDPQRRADYDARLADQRAVQELIAAGPADPLADEPSLDYRPLPPARRAERPRDFSAQPLRSTQRVAEQPSRRPWLPASLIGLLLVAVLLISWLLTGASMNSLASAPLAPPATTTPSALDQFESPIAQLRQITQSDPSNVAALTDLGNMLYNSAEIVRENAPDSALYQQRMPRWLEATQVYSRVLQVEPTNIDVRASLGESACFYGAGTGDQSFVRSGTAEVRYAAESTPDSPRILLSLSRCLLSSQPPQTREALTHLNRLVELEPAESSFAIQARQLIDRYE